MNKLSFPPTLWEIDIFTCINHFWKNDAFDVLMPVFSDASLAWWILPILSYFFALQKTPTKTWRQLGSQWVLFLLLAGTAAGLADSSANLAKNIVTRQRPLNILPYTHFYEDETWQQRSADLEQMRNSGSSFFSAHAATSTAIALILARAFPSSACLIWCIPFAVSYSRLYLGKHYPLDVFSGALAGLLAGFLVLQFYRFCVKYRRGLPWFQSSQ